MKREIILTNDGSSSLFVPELNETYHSIHGAIAEAKHVFLKKGLEEKKHLEIVRILEVGFGTGLNCLLTYLKSKNENLNIEYTGIEKYPITPEELKAVNYGIELNAVKEFDEINKSEWENIAVISDNFKLKKLKFDLESDDLIGPFDLVYFDAFAPNKQAAMWTSEIFTKIYNQLEKDGLLVTYCCQGQVKRTLKEVGFEVQKTDGPPGKREMLTARK